MGSGAKSVIFNSAPQPGYLHQVVGPSIGSFSMSWPQESLSSAVLLLAIIVLLVTCCGAVGLVIAACCGSRRRDAVAEGADSRWLPGVGVIDYVPPSERSSVRVSLLLDDAGNDPTLQLSEPLMPLTHLSPITSSQYRPFRETLDSPEFPLICPQTTAQYGETSSHRNKYIQQEEQETNVEELTDVAMCIGTSIMFSNCRYKDGYHESSHRDVRNCSTSISCCQDSNEVMKIRKKNIKREKKVKQLKEEIEIIELKMKDHKKPSGEQIQVHIDINNYNKYDREYYQHSIQFHTFNKNIVKSEKKQKSESLEKYNSEKIFQYMWQTYNVPHKS